MEDKKTAICFTILPNKSQKFIFHQNDSRTCKIEFAIYGTSLLDPLTDIKAASLTIKNPSGKTITYGMSDITILNNVVTFTLPTTALNISGNYSGELMIYGDSYERMTICKIRYIAIAELIFDTPIQDDEHFPVLTSLIDTVNNMSEEMSADNSTYENNELARNTAETSRASAETNRVVAEVKRETDYNTYKNVMIAESNVAALQNEINANTTSLASMLNKITSIMINLKYPPIPMVGLKFDGVTDDSTALQNILNTIKNNGYSSAILKSTGERAYLGASVTIPFGLNNVTLEGMSHNAYIGSIFKSDKDIPLFIVLGDHTHFKNIGFENTHGTLVRGYDAWGTGIQVGDDTTQNPDEFTVEHCEFYNMTYGIRAKGQNYNMENNLFSYIRTSAIYLEGRTTVAETDTNGFGLDYYNRDISIANNRFHGLYGDGININLSSLHKELLIADNIFDDINRAIIGKAIRSKITNNILGRVRNDGIYIDNSGYDEPITIEGNMIVGISHSLDGTATAPSTSAYNYEIGDGIHVTGKNTNIVNNTIAHKVGHGIWIGSGSDSSQINNNTIIDADNYNTTTYDAIHNESNLVNIDNNTCKRTSSAGKQRYAIYNSGANCYFGAGNQYGATSGSSAFYDSSSTSIGYASNLGMYRKVLYGGAGPSVTSNLQKGDRWINVLATNTGDVSEYQFNGTAWKAISVLGS